MPGFISISDLSSQGPDLQDTGYWPETDAAGRERLAQAPTVILSTPQGGSMKREGWAWQLKGLFSWAFQKTKKPEMPLEKKLEAKAFAAMPLLQNTRKSHESLGDLVVEMEVPPMVLADPNELYRFEQRKLNSYARWAHFEFFTLESGRPALRVQSQKESSSSGFKLNGYPLNNGNERSLDASNILEWKEGGSLIRVGLHFPRKLFGNNDGGNLIRSSQGIEEFLIHLKSLGLEELADNVRAVYLRKKPTALIPKFFGLRSYVVRARNQAYGPLSAENDTTLRQFLKDEQNLADEIPQGHESLRKQVLTYWQKVVSDVSPAVPDDELLDSLIKVLFKGESSTIIDPNFARRFIEVLTQWRYVSPFSLIKMDQGYALERADQEKGAFITAWNHWERDISQKAIEVITDPQFNQRWLINPHARALLKKEGTTLYLGLGVDNRDTRLSIFDLLKKSSFPTGFNVYVYSLTEDSWNQSFPWNKTSLSSISRIEPLFLSPSGARSIDERQWFVPSSADTREEASLPLSRPRDLLDLKEDDEPGFDNLPELTMPARDLESIFSISPELAEDEEVSFDDNSDEPTLPMRQFERSLGLELSRQLSPSSNPWRAVRTPAKLRANRSIRSVLTRVP